MAAQPSGLEDEGIVPSLFQYMWRRDELECNVRDVWLPDTVVYKHRQVAHWFFTGRDGVLKKKHKSNCTNARIEVRPPPPPPPYSHMADTHGLVYGVCGEDAGWVRGGGCVVPAWRLFGHFLAVPPRPPPPAPLPLLCYYVSPV